jgi:hypothetical protein
MQRRTVAAAIAISLLLSFGEGLVAGNAPPGYGEQDTTQSARHAGQDATKAAQPAIHEAADKVDEGAKKPENKTAPS